jgi:hypothetical protein
MNEDLPVACEMRALSREERERQAELLARVRARIAGRVELSDGFELRLPAEGASFVEAAEWIALERRCCRFAGFELAWRDDREFTIRLSGPAGSKEVFAAAMGLAPPS